MAKRSVSQMLTGGTNDVNPQYLSATVTESAANTFTQVDVAVPVLRGFQGAGRGKKYQVIELLKIWFDLTPGDGATASNRNVQLSTTSQAALIQLNDPDLIAKWSDAIVITTSGLFNPVMPAVLDFTDSAGHGLIIATETLHFGLIGTSQTNPLTARMRMFYRFKNISVDEFVGLSIQQGG